jgi:predicted MFS family arabinose efflux permease
MNTSAIQTSKLWSRPFIFIMFANAIMFMAFEMLLPTLPLFVSHIGGNVSLIGIVTGIFMFSAILIRPFTAALAARMNKKYLLLIGVAICAVMTGAYYLAPNIGTILVFRVLHGLGFGLATTFFATIVTENIPMNRMGEGMGYFGVGETVAISMGPLMGTSIQLKFGYEGVFLGGMTIILLALLLIVFVSRKPQKVHCDNPSHVPVKLLEKKVLFPSLLTMLVGVAAGSIMSFVALYALEKSISTVAWFFFVVAVASFTVRLVSGRLFDRHGPGVVLIPSALLMMAGLWVLTIAGTNMVFLIAAALYGCGFGAIFPCLQTWCVNLVEEHEREHAMASFFNFFDLGIGGGAMILGIIASVFSYQVLYDIAIVVVGLSLVLYLAYATKKRHL